MRRATPEPVFLSSITDLMTSLAVIFIMLLIFFIKKEYAEAARAEAVSKQLDTVLLSSQTLKDELKRRLAKEGYPAEDDPKDSLAIVYHASAENLKFDVNKDVLKPAGEEYLDEFIPVLVSVVTDKKIFPALRSVLIEGHTDSDGNDEHNLQLSQERAFAVLKYALNSCDLNYTEYERFLDLTSISGRGKRDLLPPGSDDGEENKARSRRVEFKIRVRSFEEKDEEFSALRAKLKGQKASDVDSDSDSDEHADED